MKQKKSKWLVPVVLSGLTVLLYAMTGRRRRDVYLHDFSVSEDGATLVLDVAMRNGNGKVRAVTAKGDGSSVYVSFYSAYGLSGSVGAEHIFPIRLPERTDKLYFAGGSDAWVLTLEKENGIWRIVEG